MAPNFIVIRRLVAWFSIAILGVASWLPGDEMIRTGADGRLEHGAAYLISGLAVFSAYPRRLKWPIAILMMCYAGILEFGQLWVPGRHAGILDWAASSGGVLCALLLYDASQRFYAWAGEKGTPLPARNDRAQRACFRKRRWIKQGRAAGC
jgi:hypothetical protein